MSDLMAIGTKISGIYVLRLFAGLLLGFSFGVDVARRHPQSALLLGLIAFPSAIVLIFIGALWEKRQRDSRADESPD